MDLINGIKEIFKEKGYKLTFQRRAILNSILQNPGEHLSSEEIYNWVKNDYCHIGLATVYRSLQLFEDLEIITKINFDDGVWRYELNIDSEKHQHHHLICIKCGVVIEVQADLLDHLEEQIEKNYNFQIDDHSAKFFGICSECRGVVNKAEKRLTS